ncbi:discoidin domain-containing receptor 2-like [Penaeus japonicus]|uniref:discoidin domain-containing receptor 2-like n=1 Tax=Penaeus japonicus TaxID=27405 RepID=UPI001C711051|nr:discoidin domain-containing receptor 2-like [Penaeus japonicus]
MEPPVLLPLLVLVLVSRASCLQTGRCDAALGMQSGAIPDEHISASSYFDAAVNAIYGRAHVEAGGGAWCPRDMVYHEGKEFLEVNLGGLHVVAKVEVQGRFGNGQGREFARQYKLQFWRPGLAHWVTYRDGRGEELLEGNTNTYLAQSSQLTPPIVAARVRFVPYSDHPRTVCMRVEVYGCPYTDGLLSYSMPDGDPRGGDGALRDLTYDGARKDGWLSGGLGQLTDGETGHTNFRVDALGIGRGYEWIGWKNDTRQTRPVEITFEFDAVRNFSALHIYTNNFFTKDTQVFSHARVLFSAGGEHFPEARAVDYEYVVDRIFENARNVTIRLHNAAAKYVKLQLFFALRWIMISEVAFDSVPCRCNMTPEEPPTPPPTTRAEDEGAVKARAPIVPAQSTSSLLLLVGLVVLGAVFVMIPIALGVLYYRTRLARKTKKKSPGSENGVDAKKVSMKMKDLHINVNLTPMTNGYSRAKGKLYGQVALEEEAAAMYQEPFKGPVHNPGYHTLGHSASASETPLKCPLPLDTDDSVDYAVPDVNMTPPPPFSEVYSPPPPVPLTRPPSTLPTVRSTQRDGGLAPPIPPIPPPPKQDYYTAPHMCQSSVIQGVTGTVIYAAADATNLAKERSVPEVPRSHIRVLETLGEGVFGVVQLCEVKCPPGLGSRKVAVKCLKLGASEETKEDFRQESRILSRIDDPNIVRLLGIVSSSEPLCMLLEYMDYGDLYQFLRRHVAEGIAAPVAARNHMEPRVLSYGALVYIASQVASGMKHLESLSFVHRDLATRNCLVGSGLCVKISDFGMSRPVYSSDYYRLNDSRALLPIRWMAWEAILQGRFSTKSDVWAFGVTLWEILTMARQQPYDELSDDGVLENVSHCYHGDGSGMMLLPHPPLCPREMYDMMAACWRPNPRQRPPFWEILMFLQRKNLGYTLDYVD